MKNILDHLTQIEKSEAYKILSEVASKNIEVSIKTEKFERVVNSKIQRITTRHFFYIKSQNSVFEDNASVTIKIYLNGRMFFLKTILKIANQGFYFSGFENTFELIRRQKPRFEIPKNWAQNCFLSTTQHLLEFRSKVTVLNFSKIGARIKVEPDLPKYKLNEIVNFFFKLHRRGEVSVQSKIIYLKASRVGGPILGLEFLESSILIQNKINNVLDDLAFHYAHLSDGP
jgi:hypothetical protein